MPTAQGSRRRSAQNAPGCSWAAPREHRPADLRTIGRLGRWTATRFKLVAIAWAVIAIGLGVFAPKVEHALSGAVTAVQTVACVAGAVAGARLAGRIPQRALGRGFALLVVAVAGYLLISVAFLGRPSSIGVGSAAARVARRSHARPGVSTAITLQRSLVRAAWAGRAKATHHG